MVICLLHHPANGFAMPGEGNSVQVVLFFMDVSNMFK